MMEVTALCIRLWVDVLVLLVAQVNHSSFAQKAAAAFPRVHPDSLQFFEYEALSVSCEEFRGLTEWRVMRRLNKMIQTDNYNWSSSAPSRTINPAFEIHSGQYWCEDGEGNTSGAVNITITDGSVVLNVPARPVMVGDDVILHCRKKETESELIADLYKDGSKLRTWYQKDMMIQNVSKSDEGLYKCSVTGAGESPESRLTVLNQTLYKEPHPPHNRSPDLPSVLWFVVSVILVAVLWAVMTLLLSRKPEEPELYRAGIRSPSPDESVVYSSVIYRPLATEGRRGWSAQSSTKE